MAVCHMCRTELRGEWRCLPTQVNANLGIVDGWFLSRSVGYAWVYCNDCFSKAVMNVSAVEKAITHERKARTKTEEQLDTYKSAYEKLYRENAACLKKITSLGKELASCEKSMKQWENLYNGSQQRLVSLHELELKERSSEAMIAKLKNDIANLTAAAAKSELQTKQLPSLKHQLLVCQTREGKLRNQLHLIRQSTARVDAATVEKLTKQVEQMRQQLFNSECQRNRLSTQLSEVSCSLGKRASFLEATAEFEEVQEVWNRVPECAEVYVRQKSEGIKEVEVRLAEQIREITGKTVEQYAQRISELVEEVKNLKLEELRKLESILEATKKDLSETQMYTEKEINSITRVHTNKIKAKELELKQFTSEGPAVSSSSSWVLCLDESKISCSM